MRGAPLASVRRDCRQWSRAESSASGGRTSDSGTTKGSRELGRRLRQWAQSFHLLAANILYDAVDTLRVWETSPGKRRRSSCVGPLRFRAQGAATSNSPGRSQRVIPVIGVPMHNAFLHPAHLDLGWVAGWGMLEEPWDGFERRAISAARKRLRDYRLDMEELAVAQRLVKQPRFSSEHMQWLAEYQMGREYWQIAKRYHRTPDAVRDAVHRSARLVDVVPRPSKTRGRPQKSQ